jgi:hypothetical protein
MNDHSETNSNSNSNTNFSSSDDDIHYDPLKFVDTLSDPKHIVLFYEESKAARVVEYRYLKNGLLKGQDGIHIMPNDVDIESIQNEMADSGIDVESFIKNGFLHIRQVEDNRSHQNGRVKGFENIAKETLANLKSPSRLRTVTLHIPEVNTEEKIASKLAAEHSYHSTFHSFGGSLLCAYPIEQIEPKERGKWIEGILQNHHSAIFVTKSGQGLAFHLEKH